MHEVDKEYVEESWGGTGVGKLGVDMITFHCKQV